jgi:CcmD family protein
MGPWGFVFLAYGIVWAAILIYLVTLKRRVNRVQAELTQLQSLEDGEKDEKR